MCYDCTTSVDINHYIHRIGNSAAFFYVYCVQACLFFSAFTQAVYLSPSGCSHLSPGPLALILGSGS